MPVGSHQFSTGVGIDEDKLAVPVEVARVFGNTDADGCVVGQVLACYAAELCGVP